MAGHNANRVTALTRMIWNSTFGLIRCTSMPIRHSISSLSAPLTFVNDVKLATSHDGGKEDLRRASFEAGHFSKQTSRAVSSLTSSISRRLFSPIIIRRRPAGLESKLFARNFRGHRLIQKLCHEILPQLARWARKSSRDNIPPHILSNPKIDDTRATNVAKNNVSSPKHFFAVRSMWDFSFFSFSSFPFRLHTFNSALPSFPSYGFYKRTWVTTFVFQNSFNTVTVKTTIGAALACFFVDVSCVVTAETEIFF